MEKITFSSHFKVSGLSILIALAMSLVVYTEVHSQILPGFTDGDCYSNNPDLQSSATNRDGELDWEDVYNGNLQVVYPNSITTGIQFDDGTTEPDRSFIGGNTKDHIDLSSWQNQAGTSSDKSDIGQGGAVLINGVIYFFGNRLSSEGTTNIGFWLFQQDVQSLDGSFSGIHEVGDILIVVEVTNGGAIGTVNAFKWVGADNGTIPQSTKTLVQLNTSNNTLNAYRNINHESTPWPHQAKNDPMPNNQPPVTFFEGFIDIASLNLADTCFSSFLVETRSSSVVTSVLEDYLGGGFNVQPEVTIDDITECAENFPVDLVAKVDGGLSPLTFEWKKDGVTLENEFSSTISVNDAGTYSVIAIGTGIGGSGNCSSESDSAIITKISNPAPSVDDESVCAGAMATFSTANLGDGFTYQWYLNDVVIDGATGYEYTTAALTLAEDGDIYKVIVTDTNNPTGCTGEDSGILSVNENPAPSVDDESVCAGATATFSTADLGAGFTYQWYLNDVVIDGATGNEYTTAALTLAEDGDIYKVIVTDTNNPTGCTGADSGTLSVNANPEPSVDDESVCAGATATFSTTDLGAGFTYQWYLNDVVIDGATGNEYTTAALTLAEDGDVYKVIVTDTNNPTICTGMDSGTLTVNANPEPSVDDESVCAGATATFSTEDLGAGFTYQWYLNDVIIDGATGNEYTTAALTLAEDGDIYKVIVTDTNNPPGCTGEDSGILSVNENPAPSVDDQSVCAGATATFSTADLGNGFTYQWYLNDVIIDGATGNEYTTAALTLAEDGDIYKVIVTDTNNPTSCTGADSGILTVNANPAPSVDDESVCAGATATFSTADLGDGFTYQWYLNDVAIDGATNNEYTTAALTQAEDGDVYKVIVTDKNNPTSCTGMDSGTLSVNANPEPSVDDESVCAGAMATFSTADLGVGFTYQWYLNDVAIDGATSNEYTTAALTLAEDGDVYKVMVTDTNNPTGCTGGDSGTLSVNENPAPSVDDESVCAGATAKFSTADLGNGFTYQWYLNDVAIDGATNKEYTTAALTLAEDGNVYKVIVTDTNNPTNCTGDDFGTLSVNANPVITTEEPQLTCQGERPSIKVTSDTNGLEFRLVVKGQSGVEFTDYPIDGYDNLNYDTSYVLTAKSKTGPAFCETDYEFTTPVELDIPSSVTLMVNSPTCDSYDGSTYFGNIQITNHFPGYMYAVVMQSTFVDIESVPPSAYANYDSSSGLIANIGVGNYYIIAKSPDECLSAIAPAILMTPDCLTCETAFAKDTASADGMDSSYCFITESPFDDNVDVLNSERWGWTNEYSLSEYVTWTENEPLILNLYAAAGQCDISKGALAGYVKVYFVGDRDTGAGSFKVEYISNESELGWLIEGAQFYIGEDPYPKNGKGKNADEYTVAPGKYPFTIDTDATNHVILDALECDGVDKIYIIAHADVCTANSTEYKEQLWTEAETEFFDIGRKNNTIVYGSTSKGGKPEASSTSTFLTETSDPLFSVAPVPFRDVLNIGYLFEYTSDVTIQVFDLNGRLLATYKDSAVNSTSISSFNVDFRTKSNQIYIVRMTTDREIYTAKIIAAK